VTPPLLQRPAGSPAPCGRGSRYHRCYIVKHVSSVSEHTATLLLPWGGHTVAALQFGIPFCHVSVDLAWPHLLRDDYYPPAGFDGILALSVLCLSGPEAERLFCGTCTDEGDVADARRVLGRKYAFQLDRARDSARKLVTTPWASARIERIASDAARPVVGFGNCRTQ
jgi:hypothetical protein